MSLTERFRQEGEKKGRQEGIQVGEEKGKLERNIEIAKSMLLKGYPIEDIMFLTGLSRAHIHDLV
ncbi:MAG: hypothetical protein NMK33_04305 [Candidatus Cardinium sp.]|uniref:hypothetical protein n=1 Tax=Cardinium endosymbiont of Dermatophagoides farinae TaxID=2597823 RepID=UPI00118348B9|nr:hypothetical protein [Cardinium endosymbiont of Dermatophagoides farinae]TSJ80656.1 hypothetical protein FPG78_01050 [Cardinium endosymbiont of Dermatophagoides farinae]UWW96651.1 MAG: hypothetical protein NMK33_04305 [Candidatus Cardinium sp.]